MELQDRFYTAPEVAQVLGVTLRSLYRYIRDGKIETFKTAGGRLRFTRESITAFMGPMMRKEAPVREPQPRETVSKEPYSPYDQTESAYHFVPAPRPISREPLPRPRHLDLEENTPSARPEEMASRIAMPKTAAPIWPFRKPQVPAAPAAVTPVAAIYREPEEEEEKILETQKKKLFYRSNIRDLRLLAQKIQKSCSNAHVPYALTGFAGMSLQREMPPFSIIHIYARFDDLPFFENVLQATSTSDESLANLCFLEVTDINLWREVEAVKGFKVVAKGKLEEDLRAL